MHPTYLMRLVHDHQTEALGLRGSGRTTGRRATTRPGVVRAGVRRTGLGLVRLGVRLAGPESLPGALPSPGV